MNTSSSILQKALAQGIVFIDPRIDYAEHIEELLKK